MQTVGYKGGGCCDEERRLRWFGHVERKSVSDWVLACRSKVIEKEEFKGRRKKSYLECVKSDIKCVV